MREHDDDGAQTLYEQAHQKAPNDIIALNNLAIALCEEEGSARTRPGRCRL